jgi:hypothetical protein
MFGDGAWLPSRYREQHGRYQRFLRDVAGRRLVAIELGAGLAIPTVRWECEERCQTLIRINPREAEAPAHGIPLALGALEALERIDACLRSG